MSEESIVQISSRADFRDAVRTALARASQARSREIFMCDPTFADWPLNDVQVVDALTGWVDSRCTLTLLASGFDEIARRQLRFVAWRQQWSHVVRCRTDPELSTEQIPTLLLVPGQLVVRVLDRVRGRGTMSSQAFDLNAARDSIDALLQRSEEAFPVTTLGL